MCHVVFRRAVLGWRRLISEFLESRRLVRLGEAVATPVERYHVLRPRHREQTPSTERFSDWLVGQFNAEA